MPRRMRPLVIVSIVAVVAASLLACVWPLGNLPQPTPVIRTVPATEPPTRPPAPPAATADGGFMPNLSINAIARQVKPAVVQIANERLVRRSVGQPLPQETGIGSGVIYDRQGHILTNHHVVVGAEQLTVALPDGRRFEGKLIGSDPDTDLAVVQIQGDNLPSAPIGKSSTLEVGDWVVAIGNALGLTGGPTVTAGVVSALGRSVQEPPSGNEPGPYLYDLIQTDAAINPGNSGGPLINLRGEVVGINTLIAGTSESGYQAQGIGFAIAVDTAKPIADELVANGRVIHAYLGIYYGWLNPAQVASMNLDVQKGVIIGQVIAGSPAARAGVQVQDVIVAVDGNELADESTLGRFMRTQKPGATVTLKIVRGGRTLDVQVKLGEKPAR